MLYLHVSSSALRSVTVIYRCGEVKTHPSLFVQPLTETFLPWIGRISLSVGLEWVKTACVLSLITKQENKKLLLWSRSLLESVVLRWVILSSDINASPFIFLQRKVQKLQTTKLSPAVTAGRRVRSFQLGFPWWYTCCSWTAKFTGRNPEAPVLAATVGKNNNQQPLQKKSLFY